MNDNPEVTRLMALAKVTKGTLGLFACVPHLQSSGANSSWHPTDQAALAELERNITRNLPGLLKQEKREAACAAA